MYYLCKNSFFKKKNYDTPPPTCDLSGTYQCESAHTYLIRRLHEDVISDLPKGQPQVNDVILNAASFREIADMHHTASTCFPLCKLMGTNSSNRSSKHVSLLSSILDVPNGYLPQIMIAKL